MSHFTISRPLFGKIVYFFHNKLPTHLQRWFLSSSQRNASIQALLLAQYRPSAVLARLRVGNLLRNFWRKSWIFPVPEACAQLPSCRGHGHGFVVQQVHGPTVGGQRKVHVVHGLPGRGSHMKYIFICWCKMTQYFRQYHALFSYKVSHHNPYLFSCKVIALFEWRAWNMEHPVDAYINININGQLYTIINASTRCYTRTVYIWKKQNKTTTTLVWCWKSKHSWVYSALQDCPALQTKRDKQQQYHQSL